MNNNLVTETNNHHISNNFFLLINAQDEQNYLNQAGYIDNFIVITI